MREQSTYAVQSTSPSDCLRVGRGFKGTMHVQGSWDTIEMHGGKMVIGAAPTLVREALGLSLSDPMPAVAFVRGELLVLLGVGARRASLSLTERRSGVRRKTAPVRA